MLPTNFSLVWILCVSRHNCILVHSFIHSGYFYSSSSSPLLLRGAPDTARITCRIATDYCKFPAWRLEEDSNPRPFGRKTTNLPMSHHAQLAPPFLLHLILCLEGSSESSPSPLLFCYTLSRSKCLKPPVIVLSPFSWLLSA